MMEHSNLKSVGMFWSSCLIHAVVLLLSFNSLALHSVPISTSAGNETDRLALLAFKDQITNDPLGALSNWNHSFNYCEWVRVTCGRRNRGRVTALELSYYKLEGTLSPEIGKLSFLTIIDLSVDNFRGDIPISIFNASRLETINFDHNQFTGSVPRDLGKLRHLRKISIFSNDLGTNLGDDFSFINSLTNCTKLEELIVTNNHLEGPLPNSITNLSTQLIELSVAKNKIYGSIPSGIEKLKSLEFVDASKNRISESIPTSLGNLTQLILLDLSRNDLHGPIPKQIMSLPSLRLLDLSRNRLSGQIPNYLGGPTAFNYMNFSYNDLEGPVPINFFYVYASVEGNNRICGGPDVMQLPECDIRKPQCDIRKKGIPLKVVIPVIIVILILVILLCYLRKLNQRRMQQKNQSSLSLPSYQYPRISYAQLLDATIGFSADTLIGAGTYGTVYKGFLDQFDTMLAVKVLNLQQRGASKSFLAECNALRNVRHRNLVKIVTCCSSVDFQGNDFKALVYEFIPNGSLEEWLHQGRAQWHELTSLNFLQRLNVAIDVASVLDYLHHHCRPSIVHCDLKPSNILLNDKMTAHLSDFGLAKVFSAISSYNTSHSHGSTAVIRGSIGYIAPEYGMGALVSIKGDVYSYGILLLEMFTGKRPTDDMFQDGRNIHSYAKMAMPEHVMSIVDPTMLGGSINTANQTDSLDRMQDCIVHVIALGVKCSVESPMRRLNMGEVLNELHHIREYHQGVRVHLE